MEQVLKEVWRQAGSVRRGTLGVYGSKTSIKSPRLQLTHYLSFKIIFAKFVWVRNFCVCLLFDSVLRTYLWWSPSDDYTLGVMSMNSKWWQGARIVSKESGTFFILNKETKLWNIMILLFYSNFVITILIFICFIAPRAKQILILSIFDLI